VHRLRLARRCGSTARVTLRTGAAYAAASQVIAAAGIAFTNIVVARSLGPAGTGQFNVLVTLILFATVFVPLGLDFGIPYFVGGRQWSARAAIRRTQLLAAGTSLATLAMLGAVSTTVAGSIHGDLGSGTVFLALASIPFAVSWTLLAAVALAVGDYRAFALAPVGQAVGMSALATTGAVAFGISGAAAGLTIANACAAGFTWRRLRASPAVGREEGSGGWQIVMRAVRYGFPVSISNGLGVATRRADLLIVSAVVGATQAGPYAIALAISSMQIMLPRGLATVLLPRVARDAPARSRSSDVFARSSRHAVIVSCGTGVAVAAAAPLIPLVYGPGFQPAVELALILVPGAVAYGIAAVLTAGLIGLGRSAFPLISALAIGPPTIVAYVVGAEAFGATGAAVASSLSYTATGLIAAGYSLHVGGISAIDMFVPRREDWAAYRHLLGAASRLVSRRA